MSSSGSLLTSLLASPFSTVVSSGNSHHCSQMLPFPSPSFFLFRHDPHMCESSSSHRHTGLFSQCSFVSCIGFLWFVDTYIHCAFCSILARCHRRNETLWRRIYLYHSKTTGRMPDFRWKNTFGRPGNLRLPIILVHFEFSSFAFLSPCICGHSFPYLLSTGATGKWFWSGELLCQ